jgi:hypothetical protein
VLAVDCQVSLSVVVVGSWLSGVGCCLLPVGKDYRSLFSLSVPALNVQSTRDLH